MPITAENWGPDMSESGVSPGKWERQNRHTAGAGCVQAQRSLPRVEKGENWQLVGSVQRKVGGFRVHTSGTG